MSFVLILFVGLQIVEASGRAPVWVTSFAGDLLCLPLVLGLVLWAHRRLAGRGPAYTLPHWHGWLTLALFAVYFEGLLPHLKSGVVGDPVDVLMYLLGYLIFEGLMNHPGRRAET